MEINIYSKSVDKALAAIKHKMKDELGLGNYETWGYLGETTAGTILEHAFEKEYNCTIGSNDTYGIHGHITFTEDKYATAFVLQFGGNDEPRERMEL